MKRFRCIGALAVGVLVLSCGLTWASEYTWTFEEDPLTGTNPLELGGNIADSGDPTFDGMWRSLPGEGQGSGSDGFLAITYPVGDQRGYAIFPDIDDGDAIIAFELEAEIRSGNSATDRAADGWSVSLARSTDPALTNPGDMASFGGAYEFGTTTGVGISFDTWSGNTLPDGAADIEGLIVRVDNQTITTVALPTRHGLCDDATSLQTGPRNAEYWTGGGDAYAVESWQDLCWQPLRVVVTQTGLVSVYWKGSAVLENFQTDFFPSPGRVVLAGRTGGSNSNVHFDNIKLTTTVTEADNEPPTTPTDFATTHVGAGSVGLSWTASSDNSGNVGYEIERDTVPIGGARTATTYVDATLAKLTSYAYRVRATDIAGNKSDWATLSVTTIDDEPGIGVTAEIWDGLDGVLVYENFVNTAAWGTAANRSVSLNAISFGEPAFGNTYGDTYALMITGVLTPPVSGDFYFFTRSDDGSEFHINTEGTDLPDPLLDFADAVESGCCGPFEEIGAGQNTQVGYENTWPTTQEPISLVAGTGYGFRYIVKEGGGGDWGQLAWRLEGDDSTAASLTPIPAFYISEGRVDPVGTTITITGPEDQEAFEEVAVTISANIDVQSPYSGAPAYQWMRDGADIFGATGASYSFTTTAADDGAKFSVKVLASGVLETSQEMTLSIVPDTVPPVPSSGALVNTDGSTIDIGVGFDEPVTDATASVQANYTLNAGSMSSFTYYPESQSVLMKVTGLNPGDTGSVTVKNVSDIKGNAIPSTGTDASFTVSETLRWDIVGDVTTELSDWGPFPIDDNFVVPVADDGFDLYSNGRTQWNNYDETTFVYEEVTGDFDKKLRVEYQDNSSQWARAGLVMRERTNFGDDVDAQIGSADWNNNANAEPDGIASRYQKVHVNPVGPTLTGPGTEGNGSWEGNRRLNEGGESSSAGGGGVPLYPNAWCRLQRTGDTFTIYRSDDGQTWVQLGQTTFDPPMAAMVYVGPDYSAEIGNITNAEDRGTFLAKMRDYGDTFAVGAPSLQVTVEANGDLTLTYDGTLESSETIDGTYAPVQGAGGGQHTVTPETTGNMFYRAAN